ncbi:lysine--tRNA ligase [Candidatus Woesearchaeota archaeon]|nr:lysine--tRNA ligase [Candidatus Woesearchaeota archaeon]
MDGKKNNNDDETSLFWADQLAERIINRKKFRYVDREMPKFEKFVVKTSASISGVLHIGRLSDTIRGASVFRALKEAGVKAEFIWVAEDMDPFRKVPEGVPESYEKYIGFSVTDIPDPDGCHESYADHHKEKYFEVLHEFVFEDMKKLSTRQTYLDGEFGPYIKKILARVDKIREIQNRYRTNPLKKTWSPWTPVCENCGKIVTAKVSGISDNIVSYTCRDYMFESTVAKGCGHKGENDPVKGNGKLMWKSEWAAEWALWNICSEGAGKEYIVPNSAFWVNAEISELILDFPSPEPIFYEHLMIDGAKMSASLGNVVYPHDWLKVATPQLLIFFYNKRLMKTRSFSWKDLPQLYDEYDDAGRVFFGIKQIENEKEASHIRRLYEFSNRKGSVEEPIGMSFSHAVMLSQIFESEDGFEKSLRKTGQWKEEHRERILERLRQAREWVEMYAPESERFMVQERFSAELTEKQIEAIRLVAGRLNSGQEWNEKTLFQEFYSIMGEVGIEPKDFFRAGYLVLLNRDRGPKLAPFILALGEKALRLLEQV